MIREVDIAVNSTYLISEGFRNVFKNKKASMASLLTMFCAMFIFGIVFVIGENANSVVDQVSSSQGIQVFMNTEATDEEMEALRTSIWNLGSDKISTVVFVSKQEALESMKESFGEDSSWIFEGYEGENNIFPASYIVTLTDLSYTKEVENAIVKMDNVNKITSSNETIDTLIKIANGVKIAVSVIFVLLLIMAITIIANTIKLTVHSRRKEISIMKYVGATNGFIRGPFIVEGIIIGVVSAGLTLLVLATVYDVVIGKIAQSSVLQTMGLSLLKFSEMVQVIGIIFLGLGIGIGIIGSLISMKKYLEV
jgi:cell division transport system permease protein